MILIKVTFSNDDYALTRFNGSLDDAKRYYIGQVFNVGTGPNDNMQECVMVEKLAEVSR